MKRKHLVKKQRTEAIKKAIERLEPFVEKDPAKMASENFIWHKFRGPWNGSEVGKKCQG